jgi:hypothetical protein
MRNFIVGNWGSASLGFISVSCEISCTQDSQHFTLHTFAFSRFSNLLLFPLGFPDR